MGIIFARVNLIPLTGSLGLSTLKSTGGEGGGTTAKTQASLGFNETNIHTHTDLHTFYKAKMKSLQF